jgi:hypothetical protein
MRANLYGVVGLLALGACATRPASVATGAEATQAAAPANHNRDIITREELTDPSVAALTVLDAVKSLRPHFLTVRGSNTIPATSSVDQESGKVHASIDGNRIISVEELRGIRAGTVAEVRFLSPAAAMQRFGGTARSGPVILVKTIM